MTASDHRDYEAVAPSTATPSRLALIAERYGYDGLVVRRPPRADPQPRPDVGIDLVDGIELDPDDRAQASGAIGHYRKECELLLVRGGSPSLNRYLLEEPRVDVLTAPLADTGDLNHVLARAAATNDVAVELRLGPLLFERGRPRSGHLKALRKAIELVMDADAPYVVSAAAKSHFELRSPRDLAALGTLLELDGVAADPTEIFRSGLVHWSTIVDRNRRRQSAGFVEPGVYQGEPEDR